MASTKWSSSQRWARVLHSSLALKGTNRICSAVLKWWTYARPRTAKSLPQTRAWMKHAVESKLCWLRPMQTPDHLKTQTGEEAFNPDGLAQRSIALLKDTFPDLEVSLLSVFSLTSAMMQAIPAAVLHSQQNV